MKNIDIDKLQATMRAQSKIPAKDTETGELVLGTLNNPSPKLMYISITEFIKELKANGKSINIDNLDITDEAPETEQPPEEKPKTKKPKAASNNFWSEDELKELTWPDIRKLAAKLDVHEKSREDITSALIGKPKK